MVVDGAESCAPAFPPIVCSSVPGRNEGRKEKGENAFSIYVFINGLVDEVFLGL